MTDQAGKGKHIDQVKFYLGEAIANRKKGRLKEAEENYMDAALILMSYAKLQNTSERGKNIRRTIDILDSLTSVFHPDDPEIRKESEEEGWHILNDLGIGGSKLSKTSLEDVAGLANVKEEILSRLIYPIKFRDLSRKYGVRPSGGVLLFGPPGTGKTFLARAVANEAGAAFINVNPSRLYNQWFGQFEKNISKVFEAARKLSPAVIFFDEIETIASSRGSSREDAVSKRGVSQLLIEMEGIEKTEKEEIFILAATNRPWDLDDAILRPGRFDIQIYTPLPDAKARKKMFELNLRSLKFSEKINYSELASSSGGYSGADISYICRRAATRTFARSVEKGEEISLSNRDIVETMKEVDPSVSSDTVAMYEKFSNSRIRNR